MKTTLLKMLVLITIAGLCLHAFGTTYYVDVDGIGGGTPSDSNNGTSLTTLS